ncbi:MAG: hypothetical protein AAGI08_04795 [Bacteroidota bacterium]
MRSLLLLIGLALTGLLLAPTPGSASTESAGSASMCSCITPDSHEERMENADFTFVGFVAEARLIDAWPEGADGTYDAAQFELDVLVTFDPGDTGIPVGRAERPYPRVTVATGRGGGDCGVEMALGGLALLYVASNQDGTFYTTICAGSTPLRNDRSFEELLEYMEAAGISLD